MRPNIFFRLLLVFTLVFLPQQQVFAQESTGGPVYVVQQGDTLNIIAVRFGVSVADLISTNNLDNPNMLAAGQELIIPGLEGVQGKLITENTPLGDNLASLSRRFRIPQPMLVKLNRITSPDEVFAGANIIIPQDEQNAPMSGRTVISEGQSLLEAAVASNTSPWSMAGSNGLSGSWDALPGSALFFEGGSADAESTGIPFISRLQIDALPLTQGTTAVVRVTTLAPLQLAGSLNGKTLNFFPLDGTNNEYVALQGVHAMAKPGLVPFVLSGRAENGQTIAFQQMVLLQLGGYVEDPPLYVDPTTIDPANTKPEDDAVAAVYAPVTPTRYWQGVFRTPVDEPVCIKSWYGNRRSYNGGGFDFFHTGADYGVCANLNIYAPAPGVVVFSGPLTVRGNATYIDHGWGVYSAYFHQAETKVQVGDRVEAGQLIGLIGGTGRVTGPHLHWEIIVGGVQVQPLDWLETPYP
jgi:murein DD-endopeptidase MepM/ murein hydrolase activator NlpD